MSVRERERKGESECERKKVQAKIVSRSRDHEYSECEVSSRGLPRLCKESFCQGSHGGETGRSSLQWKRERERERGEGLSEGVSVSFRRS